MKKAKIIFTVVACCLLFVSGAVQGEDFEDSAIGQELVNIGLKFLDNPGDFFFNLHMANEDFSPVPFKRHGSIRWNFFPTTLPLSWMNLNLKVKAYGEKNFVPQIDIIGQYGDLLGLRMLEVEEGDVEPSFNDYSAGLVFSKTVAEGTQFYWGGKYSNVSMEVKLSSSSEVEFGDFKFSEVKFDIKDTFIFAGITHQKNMEDPKRLVVQMGYGLEYKKIVTRMMMSHEHYEWGIDILPEGMFVIHPFMGWHWNF